MTRKYELMVIFSPELDEPGLKAEIAVVERLVDKVKGKIVKVDDWGKRSLAYLIKKQVEGVYKLWTIELDAKVAQEVDKDLNVAENILRYLLVVARA